MAVSVVVIPTAAPGTTSTSTPVITQIPDAPVLPGVTFNGSPAEMIQFLRDLGQLPPAPVPHTPAPPLTTGQMFVRFVEQGYWGLVHMVTGIVRTVGLGLTLVLVYLLLAWNGVVPGPNWQFLMDAAGIEQVDNTPAPVRTGPSLSDRLSGIEDQLGGIRTDVDGLKVQPAPAPVVEQAPPPVVQPAPVVEEPAKKRPFRKKATP